MATIAQDILSQELYNDTEQSGEGPGQAGGKTRSGITTPNANSALGGKGVKRKLKVQTIHFHFR